MALSVGGLAHRATPIVNGDFVVVELVAGTNADLIGAIRTAVTTVGAALTPARNYPSTWMGLLIASNTTAVQIMTDNTGVPAAGINIPVGQSLYLPYEGAAAAGLEYSSGVGTISVGVFF